VNAARTEELILEKVKKELEVEIVVRKWLKIQEHDLHCDGILKHLPRWNTCVNMLLDHVEK
jgi:hypothetical protein